MGVSTDGELDIVRNFHLHHGGLIVYELLHSNDYLVDVFPVDLLAILEPLHHIIDELLRHLIAKSYAVMAGLYYHGVEIKTFGGGRFVTNFDGGKEVELAHDLLTLRKFQFGILITGIKFDAFLKVLKRIFGF